jgi:cyclopropane fatty-acyl-phospholipid synthase-like methyltransferase
MFEKIRRWMRFNLLYLGRPPWDTGMSPPELKTFLSSGDPGRALDVGCGTGTNLLTMAKAGWEVVGVDIAWLSVLRARAKLRKSGFQGRVIYGDITGDLDFQKPFNFVLDIGCYHSLSARARQDYHKNLQGWLSPKGVFMIYAHLRMSTNYSHGISSGDLEEFQKYLNLQWREDSKENRPDGGGGRPSTWARFEKKD